MSISSWGRYPKSTPSSILTPFFIADALASIQSIEGSILPFGLGRSYGDVCLNNGGSLLVTSRLNRLISWDQMSGILECESGTSIQTIIEFALPRGYFIAVSPGTKYVTVGGAIANDIHGKGHHVTGTFGCHVLEFDVAQSSGEVFTCSLSQNKNLFSATIGGLGLTGLITRVKLQLKPCPGPYVVQESIKTSTIDENFEHFQNADSKFEYTVAWLDSTAKGKNIGRGIFMQANDDPFRAATPDNIKTSPLAVFPFDAPNFLLNNPSITAFNNLYRAKQFTSKRVDSIHYSSFWHPLDIVNDWNRAYGKRGLLQYQFVVPMSTASHVIPEVLERFAKKRFGSFLTVLKIFGDKPSPGLISFPLPGATLTLDIPMVGPELLSFLDEMDVVVLKHGGRLYPAKDARMSSEVFQECFPNWRKLSEIKDPHFSSSFWRRVTNQHT